MNFINSLRDAPEKMYLVGTDINKYHLGWAKTDKKYLVPPFDHPEYIDKLNELIEKEKIEFVHAQPDGEVRLLSENREKIKARLYLPKKETIRICQDKFASGKIWKEKGLPLVETMYISNLKDLKRAERIFSYPYWIRASVGYSSRGSTLVENEKAARDISLSQNGLLIFMDMDTTF